MKYEDKITSYAILKAGFSDSCMRVIPLASFMRILSLVFVLTASQMSWCYMLAYVTHRPICFPAKAWIKEQAGALTLNISLFLCVSG